MWPCPSLSLGLISPTWGAPLRPVASSKLCPDLQIVDGDADLPWLQTLLQERAHPAV